MKQDIFPFFNGTAQVFGDPIVIYRRMLRALGKPIEKQVGLTKGQNELLNLEAYASLYAAVRAAFPMVPFDPATGSGATESDCQKALDSLLSWLEKKNGSIPGLQTSSSQPVGRPG
jgi:hypothetical protein